MTPELSIVIPVYNESPNISRLYEELTDVLGQYGRSYELVLVDDGSRDDTFAQLSAFQARTPPAGDPLPPQLRPDRGVRGRHRLRARSAHRALRRGPPERPARHPQMVARIEAGHDIVCGWRKDRKDTFITRRVPSILANKLISWATGVELHDYGCSLKVFRSEVLKPLRLYGEMHRFIPAIASQVGVSIDEVVVNHRARQAGTSKYGLSRTIRVLLDLATVKFLLNYSTRPLQIFGLLGIGALGLGTLITAWLGYVRLFERQAIGDRPLLLLGMMLLFIGVQLVTFGLLAELLARTYYESQNKPTYVIREIRQTAELASVDG
ncbi:MAG: glycosyltransferase family 2 protein [Vicinamibacterales bacterium]